MEDEVKDKPVKTKEPLTKKQLLNNHIVLMRKVVRKSRVHVINKLTKEAKKLKERKGPEKAQEKAKRKAERLLQELQLIKHLKEDKISIFALQDNTKLEDVLQNPQSTTENRALSRFSHNQLIQAEVKKYRIINPHWDLQIPVLLEKNKDKRRKINKKLAEREAAKNSGNNQKVLEKKSKDVDDSEAEDDDSLGEDPETTSEQEDSENEELEESPKKQSSEPESSSEDECDIKEEASKNKQKKVPNRPKPEVTLKSKQLLQESSSEISKLESKPKLTKKEKRAAKKLLNTPVPINLDIGKSVGTVKVQFLKDLEDLEDTPSTVKLTADDSEVIKSLTAKPKSSFFVGGVDEEPKERPAPQRQQRQGNNNNQRERGPSRNSEEFKPIFRKGKLVNKGPKRFPPPSRSSDRQPRNNFNNDYSSNLIPLGNKTSRSDKPQLLKKPTYGNRNDSSVSSAPEKLHPSWEAKKRLQQQPSLSEFKGKKIKFDD